MRKRRRGAMCRMWWGAKKGEKGWLSSLMHERNQLYPYFNLISSIRRSVSMSAGSSPKVGWKWKWSNGVGKSEMSIIWCISITNNVKSNKKNHWNSSNGQIHWFPIDFLWKWSIMDQNYANANAFFSDWNIFLRYPGYTIWKLTSRAFWKCGSFCCYNFLNPSYG